jgi:hypothetical protein
VVEVRKYDSNGRALVPVCQSLPWLSSGAVLAGETSTSLALSKIFCIDWATLEFSGPTTPRTSLLPTSLVAFCWPEFGWPWSSSGSILNSTPGTSSFLLAVLMARSTEFLMPCPRADRSPVSGTETPMTTVVFAPSFPPLLLSSRDPQAVRVRAPVVSTVVSTSKER